MRFALLGLVFGLVLDCVGISFGAWSYASPLVMLLWLPLMPCFYLLRPKGNKHIGAFFTGFYGFLLEACFIYFKLLEYHIKPTHYVTMDGSWFPAGMLGWVLVIPIFFLIAEDFYDSLERKSGWMIAGLLATLIVVSLGVMFTAIYVLIPV